MAETLHSSDHIKMLIDCKLVPNQVVLGTQSDGFALGLTVEGLDWLSDNVGISSGSLLLHGENRESCGLSSTVRS